LNNLPQLFAYNILPILLAASAGWTLQKFLNVDPKPISRITFYIFTPALVFTLLSTSDIKGDGILRMMGLAVTVMVIILLLGLLVSRVMKLKPELTAALLLPAVFMNAGNYGLSVTHFAFGDEALAWASIFFICSAMTINSLGVYIATVGKMTPLRALKGLLRIPAVYAIPLALLLRGNGSPPLPNSLWRPVELLGSAAVPSMLILLGMQIGRSGLPKRIGLLSLAIVLRMLLSPLVAWFLAPIFQMDGPSRQAAILESAMPSAVMTTILGIEFDVEPEFITSAVLFTTILSPFTITPLIAILS
jgi:predicted permease